MADLRSHGRDERAIPACPFYNLRINLASKLTRGNLWVEGKMPKNHVKAVACAFLLTGAGWMAVAEAGKAVYPAMAPLDQYLIADEQSEVALARSAAPPSISDGAEVMVLGRDGYKTAVKGTNGFLCIVERSWAQTDDQAEFWNPQMRAPNCYNSQAARSFVPYYLMKTRLVLAGKSRSEVVQDMASALDKKELPALEPGAMAYMMSKQQYLNDRGKSWHPHAMFFYAGDMTKNWAANDPASPVMVANDPERRITTLFVIADKWSDGTAAPPNMP
jgi:hypothetical protein